MKASSFFKSISFVNMYFILLVKIIIQSTYFINDQTNKTDFL